MVNEILCPQRLYNKRSKAVALILFGLLIAAVLLLFTQAAWAEQPGWKYVYNPPGDKIKNLNSLAHGGGIYVAVGNGGVIISSADGKDWFRCLPKTKENIVNVKYLNNLFVATGNNFILTSSDGVNWDFNSFVNIVDITYGKEKFIAADKTGDIFSSTDFKQWTKLTVPGGKNGLSYIDFVNDWFIASNTMGALFISNDGANWAMENGPGLLAKVVYSGDRFLTICLENGKKYSSKNLVDWDEESSGIYPGMVLKDLINNNDKYYLVNGKYVITQNGFTRMLNTGNDFDVYAIVANGGLMAVSSNGLVMSYPGSGWFEPNIIKPLNKISFENDKFVSTGQGKTSVTSLDGEKWILDINGERIITKGIVSDGRLQAKIDSQGSILTSTDGVSWSKPQLPENTDKVTAIACGNGKFVAITADKKVLMSLDGVKWGTVNTDLRPSFKPTGIAFGEGIFVATSGDRFFASGNGLFWEEYPGFTCPTGLLDITYGNGIFAALHRNGYILTCPASAIDSTIKQTNQRREIINKTVIIKLNGNKFIPIKGPVLMVDDRLMLPLREVLEPLGAQMLWDEATKTVTIFGGETRVSLRIGDSRAYINGNVITVSPAPELLNEKTMVPVRFICEALGDKVAWDDSKYSLSITTQTGGIQ
jgi:hypothetical protein